jgi:hypothetical protein
MELVSVSLAAFGCHPDALLQAKAAGVSTETIRMIFKSQNAVKHYTQAERAAIQRRAKEKLKQVNPENYNTEDDFLRDCTNDLMANHNHDRGRAEQNVIRYGLSEIMVLIMGHLKHSNLNFVRPRRRLRGQNQNR